MNWNYSTQDYIFVSPEIENCCDPVVRISSTAGVVYKLYSRRRLLPNWSALWSCIIKGVYIITSSSSIDTRMLYFSRQSLNNIGRFLSCLSNLFLFTHFFLFFLNRMDFFNRSLVLFTMNFYFRLAIWICLLYLTLLVSSGAVILICNHNVLMFLVHMMSCV